MTNLELLIKSVEDKRPISFEYNKTGKVSGTRIGNVYAIFIFTSKTGEKSTKLHIVQTSGVSDTKEEKPFPDFRMFNIGDIEKIQVLSDEPIFDINHKKYNPDWSGYKHILAKV